MMPVMYCKIALLDPLLSSSIIGTAQTWDRLRATSIHTVKATWMHTPFFMVIVAWYKFIARMKYVQDAHSCWLFILPKVHARESCTSSFRGSTETPFGQVHIVNLWCQQVVLKPKIGSLHMRLPDYMLMNYIERTHFCGDFPQDMDVLPISFPLQLESNCLELLSYPQGGKWKTKPYSYLQATSSSHEESRRLRSQMQILSTISSLCTLSKSNGHMQIWFMSSVIVMIALCSQ